MEQPSIPKQAFFTFLPRQYLQSTGWSPRILKSPTIDIRAEAHALKDEYVSTEHLLLAISADRNDPAARLLLGAGVEREAIVEQFGRERGVGGQNDEELVETARAHPGGEGSFVGHALLESVIEEV